MNTSELAARLAAACGLSRAAARRVIAALFDPRNGVIAEALARGDPVHIGSLGTFRLERRAARHGRNPATGESIRIPAHAWMVFRASWRSNDEGRRRPSGAAKRKPERPGSETTGKARRGTADDRDRSPRHLPDVTSPASTEDLLLGGEPPGDVQFTAYHPKEIVPQRWYTFLAYAHLPEALADVKKDSLSRIGAGAERYGRKQGAATAVIKRGAEVTVVPELPGCRFNPTRGTFTWLKDWHRAEFELQATPEQAGHAAGQAVNGRVAFYVGPVLVGEVKICALLSEAEASQPEVHGEPVTSDAYRRIFVSYAHQDARIVKALAKAYQALGDTYLRDVTTLRSGQRWNPALLRMIEQADIFQLCWSAAAKRSKYVRQEWRHALKQERPEAFIRPTYWDVPMPAPPAELADIHFARLELD